MEPTQQALDKPRAVAVKLSDDAMKRVVGGAALTHASVGTLQLQVVNLQAVAGRMFQVL